MSQMQVGGGGQQTYSTYFLNVIDLVLYETILYEIEYQNLQNLRRRSILMFQNWLLIGRSYCKLV